MQFMEASNADILLWDPENDPDLAEWLDEQLRRRGFWFETLRVPCLDEPLVINIDRTTGDVLFSPTRPRRRR